MPHASAAQLFSLYDDARAKALAPVQKASIARIDSLLKTAGGAKLETVAELGKVREMIDGGIVSSSLSMPMVWDYFTGSDRRTAQAVLTFKPNGTLALVSNDQVRTDLGRWSATLDPKVLKVTLETNRGEERCLFKITGSDAELERPVGTRYLRVKP